MALILGILAALSWGGHDFLVGYISDRISAYSALMAVLVFGAFFQVPLVVYFEEIQLLTRQQYFWGSVAGIGYALGGLGLYKAFAIGPVALVSPLVASFSIWVALLSFFQGAGPNFSDWIAIIVSVIGIAIVARYTSDLSPNRSNRRVAIYWSLLGSLGFGVSFFAGQEFSVLGNELNTTLYSRLVSIVTLALICIVMQMRLGIKRELWPWLIFLSALDLIAMLSVFLAGKFPNGFYAAVGASAFGLVTIVMAWKLLGERLNYQQWLGVAVCFSAIAYLAI